MLQFVFGVHLHQPVGNFDHVFEQHVREAYLPFLQAAARAEFLPIALHVSGPLLEWMEAHDTAYLDLVGRLAAEGKVELLLSGFYEPVLIALPRPDRLEQIAWMKEALQRRFGVRATGLWLTERVWEPDLAADLVEAGVSYVLVDDRHFLVSGFERSQLHAPFRTEHGGKQLGVLPIDERLRYLIPFKPPADTVAYLRELRSAGHRLTVLADDGEKFGGWPGTREWVFERGWLDRFFAAMRELVQHGEVVLTTPSAALAEVPSAGLTYLPSASYREMEGWALPPAAAARLTRLEREVGEQRVAGAEGALLRGTHWRNFFVKYSEANRMHKKMQALSILCRARGNPDGPRRAIGRAQCNDAYWHGVFGGLYLKHLREAIWQELALAEAELRRGEPLAWDVVDLDADGHDEIWVHSPAFSALVSPARGGAVEEYTVFAAGRNYADALTRRWEAYHAANDAPPHAAAASEGTPSIHDLERGLTVAESPPTDAEDRALLVDRVLPGDLAFEVHARGQYRAVRSWARAPLIADVLVAEGSLEIVLRPTPGAESDLLEKRISFGEHGELAVRYRWDPSRFPPDTVFAPELSLGYELHLATTPAAEVWSFPIATVAKSERGLDETIQGVSLTPRWPIAVGEAEIRLSLPS